MDIQLKKPLVRTMSPRTELRLSIGVRVEFRLVECSVQGGHIDACRYLLERTGKSLANEENYSHNTPLEWTAWSGSLDVVKMFIEDYGADPHFVGDSGDTAAHWACAGGSLPVCQYLAELGVDFSKQSVCKGWTPQALAEYGGHNEVIDWVVQKLYSGEPDLAALDENRKEVAAAIEQDAKRNTVKS
jgi:ankyrin repeat protein